MGQYDALWNEVNGQSDRSNAVRRTGERTRAIRGQYDDLWEEVSRPAARPDPVATSAAVARSAEPQPVTPSMPSGSWAAASGLSRATQQDTTPRVSLPGSVLDGMPNPARARAIEDVGAPLSVEGQRQVQDEYNRAPPERRAAMSARRDFVGGASRALDRKFEESDPYTRSVFGPIGGEERVVAPAEQRGFVDNTLAQLEAGWNQILSSAQGWKQADASDAIAAFEEKYGKGAELAPADKRAEYEQYLSIAQQAAEKGREYGIESQRLTEGPGARLATVELRKLMRREDLPFVENAMRSMQAIGKDPGGVIWDIGLSSALPSLAGAAAAFVMGRTGLKPAAIAGGSVSAATEFGNEYAQRRAKGIGHEEAWKDSAIKSGVIGAFDAASFFTGGKAFRAVADDLIAKRLVSAATTIAKEAGRQGLLGAAGEGVGSLAIGEAPNAASMAAEFAGEFATAPLDSVSTYQATGNTPARQIASALQDTVDSTSIDSRAVDAAAIDLLRTGDSRYIDPRQTTVAAALADSEQSSESGQQSSAGQDGEVLSTNNTNTQQPATAGNAVNDDEELLRRAAATERVYDEEGNEVQSTAVDQQNNAADPPTAVDTAVDTAADTTAATPSADVTPAFPLGDSKIWEPGVDLPEPSTYESIEPASRASQQKILDGLVASPLFVSEGMTDVKLAVPDEIGQSSYDSLRQLARTYKKLFNVNVILADFGNSKNHGYFDDKSGAVLLNVRSPNLTQTVGHEAFHAFEKRFPELFAPMYAATVQLAVPETMVTMFSAYGLMENKNGRTELGKAVDALAANPTNQAARQNLAAVLADPKNAVARSELLAHMVGQASTPAMYAELVRRSGSASKANKVIQTLTNFLNGLYQKLFGRTLNHIDGPDGVKQIQRMMNDIHNEVQIRTAQSRADAKAKRAAQPAPVANTTAVESTTAATPAAPPAPAANTAASPQPTVIEAGQPFASVSEFVDAVKAKDPKTNTEQARKYANDNSDEITREFVRRNDEERVRQQNKTAVNQAATAVEQPVSGSVPAKPTSVGTPSLLEAGKNQIGALTAGQEKVEGIKRKAKKRAESKEKLAVAPAANAEPPTAVEQSAPANKKQKKNTPSVDAGNQQSAPEAVSPTTADAQQNGAKTSKKGVMTRKQAEEKLDDLAIDPETKKSQVMTLARKMIGAGLMPADEMGNLEQISKDRDMGPDDLISEIEAYVREETNEDPGSGLLSKELIGGFNTNTAKNGSMKVSGDVAAIRAALPDGVVGRPTAGGLVFTTSDAPRVRAALAGKKLGYGRQGAILRDLPMRDGKYVGAPEKFNTPATLPALRRLLRKLTDEGAAGRYWYENSSKAVLRFTGGNVQEARKFVALLAIYSPQAKVDANSTFALRAWAQYKAGKPIEVKTGVQDTKAQEAMSDVDKFWSGEKTGNFYLNLLRMIDPSTEGKQGATIDMWMMRAGQYPTDAPTDTQYSFMENETNRIAAALGWEPQQVQAAIWVAMKARMEDKGVKKATEATSEENGWIRFDDRVSKKGKKSKVRVVINEQEHRDNWLRYAFAHKVTPKNTADAKFDFEDGVLRHIGHVSFEARPGRTTNVLPGIHSAPYAQQMEFQQAVDRAFYDEFGNDLLAVKLGLLVESNDILAPGIWQGEISPSNQKQVAMAPNPGKGERNKIDPAQKSLLNVYSAVAGLVARQEGVGYHKPFHSATKRDSNALDIDIGRPINPAEAADLNSAIDRWMLANNVPNWNEDFAIIASPKGVRLVNFGAVTNAVLQTEVMAAAAEALPDGQVDLFASDGDLIGNKWKENPDGQAYVERIRAEGRSDVLEWVRDFLAPRVQAVFDEYSEKYGWGDPGGIPDGLRSGRAGDEGNARFSRAIQYEAQVKGDAPDFNDRPIQPEAVSLVGYHYSGLRRATLVGNSYGSATSKNKGQEYERVMAAKDRRLRKRVYFYTAPMAEIPRSEPVVVGAEVHKTNLLNIFDPRSDDSRISTSNNRDEFESSVINAGYDGYVAHGYGMVVLLDTKPIPVQHLGTKQALAGSIGTNPVMSGAVKINFPVRSYIASDGKLTKRAEGFLTLAQSDAVKQAAPSFGMEYGEYKVSPNEKEQANAALEEVGSDFRFSRQLGINIRNDGDNRYADLIVDGEKTMESRDSNSLRPYIGKTVGVVRTGEGPAKLIGSVKIGEPIQVNEQKFRELSEEHLVPAGSTFDIKRGGTKFLYPLTEAKRFEEERDVDSRGIVSREVRFSRQIESPEFKRWFGDSKIVNQDGTPKVMYHGTARDITEFRPKQANAIFVTDSPSFAQDFSAQSEEWMIENADQILSPAQRSMAIDRAISNFRRSQVARTMKPLESARVIAEMRTGRTFDRAGMRLIESEYISFLPTGPNILPLFVKAERPFDYENEDHIQQLLNTNEGKDLQERPDFRLELRAIRDGSWGFIESPRVQRAIKAAGFDSFYVKENDVKNLAVYQSTQLKSAIGNNGEFSSENPDVRFSRLIELSHSAIEQINKRTPVVISRTAQGVEDTAFEKRIEIIRSVYKELPQGYNLPVPSMISSNAMRISKMPHQAVTWSIGILDKVLFSKHAADFDGVTAAEINRSMRDPVAILKSSRADDEFDIITDIVRTNEEGKVGPVVIIVKTNAVFNPVGRWVVRHTAVKSAYIRPIAGRDNVSERIGNTENIRYLDLGRARDVFDKAKGGRLPEEAIRRELSKRRIPDWVNVVGEIGDRYDGPVEDMPLFSRPLTEAEREVESSFRKDLEDNYEAKKAQYWRESPGTLDVDKARDLSPEYEREPSKYSAAVHEPASDFIKQLYAEQLSSMPKGSIVLFSAGGGGSGKGYILGGFAADISRAADLVYDTTMSGFESGQRRIQAAIDAGHKVSVVLVYRDPVAALDGAIGRAAKTGRVVPINVMAKDHAAGRDAVKRLVEYYAGNPSFSAVAVDNNGTTPRYVSIDQVEQIDENNVLEDLYDELDRQSQNPELAGVVAAFRAASPVRPADQQRMGRGRRGEVVGREDSPVRAGEESPVAGGLPQAGDGLLSRNVLSQGDRFTLPERSVAERISNKFANEVSRVEDIQKDIVRQGGLLTDNSNVQWAQTRMYRQSAAAVKRFRLTKVRPLMQKIARAGIQLDDLAMYLYASHAQARNAYIASINPQFPDGGSGMFDDEAKQKLAAFRARPDYQTFRQLAKELQSITADTAQVLVDGGLVDKNQVSAWQNTYKGTYIPLKGWEDIDESMKVNHRSDPRVPFAKRALGRGSRAGQIIENILGDYERAHVAVQKNNVRKAFYRFVLDNPDEQLWEPQRIILTKRFNKGAVLSPLAMAEGNVTYSATVDNREGQTVAVRIGGQLKSIWVKDEAMLDDLARAIDAVDGDTRLAMRTLMGINRALAKSYTALSPAFVLTNATRDLQTALLATGIEKKGGFWRAAKMSAQLIPLAWNIWKASRNNEWTAVGNRYRDAYIAMRNAGGEQGFMGFMDLQDRQRDLNQIIEETQNRIRLNPKSWYIESRKMVRAAHDFIMDINGSIENAARVAAYAEALKAGESQESAVNTAANVTVDFARRGKWTPWISGLWLFANPAIQGARRVAALAFSPKGAAFTGGLVTLGYMTAMMSIGATGDDDEPYWDKPDVQDTKLKALLFFDPEGNQYKIPLAYGWGFFVNVGYAIADIQRGRGVGRAAAFLTNSLFQHFSPLGVTDNMASFFGPTLLDPVIAISTNMTERGRPLMPDNSGDREEPDSERYWAATRGTYTQKATTWLNEFTEGSTVVPGGISVSPETVNYVRNFVLGGAGQFVTDTASSIYLTATLGGSTAIEKNKVPILKSFYRSKDIKGEQAAFFENSKEALQAFKEAQTYWGRPDSSTAVQERINQNGGLAALGKSLTKYNKALSNLRKEEVWYIDNENMSDSDKEAARRGIDQQRKQLYDEFNRAFNIEKSNIEK